ncbi:MAG: VCBS repeat-containing protein, partial [Calditrichaeota bacterium]|nr:VCBS repeat-containing protein [Calditrichota bacterium]
MKALKQLKISVFIAFLTISFFLSCKSGDQQQKALDMIKARTMGLAYIEENKLPEAEETFKQLIKIAPNEALGYANLGLVYIRMGDFNQAEEQLKKALDITPNDPEILLNYAEVMQLTNRGNQAIALLEESIKYNPDHIRTLYKLGQNYAQSAEPTVRQKAEKLLRKVVDFLPANITARLDLVELFLKEEKSDLAAEYFEKIKSQMPVFPEGADEFYQKSLRLMLENKGKESLQPFNIFRNILKPTPLYKVGFDELKGIGGPLIGTPVITFHQDLNVSGQSQQVVLDAIRFTDATKAAGLDILPVLKSESSQNGPVYYRLASADFDGNGTQDLYASGWNEQENKSSRFLLSNNFGKFIDISAEAGINHAGIDKDAIFADYDNDGYLDLFIVGSKANVLYYHYAPQKFRNVASEAGVKNDGSDNVACFADFDHDGDLDIYTANQSQNKFFRNNLDGTFLENSKKMGISGNNTPSKAAAFGDFDDDGDIDLFVINSVASNTLYSNLRQGQFADVTNDFGLSDQGGSTALAVGDYNNDGLQDLLITNSGQFGYTLFANKNGKEFEKDARSAEMQSVLKNYICSDVHFFDFDNDGFLDLIFAGKPRQGDPKGKGLLLFHNDGTGIFKDVSNLLPATQSAGAQIVLADYNEDGDQDIFFSGENDRVYLLRNDGGNANHYLNVQLVGLRTGSGKNNYFGIGAKLEVKAGELYQ